MRVLATTVAPVLVLSYLFSACAGTPASGDDDMTTEVTPSPGTPTPSPTPTLAPTSSPTPEPTPVPVLRIISSLPGQGAMAVPRDTAFSFLFSAPVTADLAVFETTVTAADGETWVLEHPSLSEDGRTLTYPPVGLARDTDYVLATTMQASSAQVAQPESWPLSLEAYFTTRVPCGIAFNIANGVMLEQLGGNEDLLGLLNDALSAAYLNPVALMFVDTYADLELPLLSVDIASGLAYYSDVPGEEGLFVVDDTFGFPVSMTDCSVAEDGALACGPQTFVFPIPITDATILNLYISDATITGTLVPYPGEGLDEPDYVWLEDFRLAGVITQEDIDRIGEETGLSKVIDALLVLDQDLDGDGVEDAASAAATSEPYWIEFTHCDPFQAQAGVR